MSEPYVAQGGGNHNPINRLIRLPRQLKQYIRSHVTSIRTTRIARLHRDIVWLKRCGPAWY